MVRGKKCCVSAAVHCDGRDALAADIRRRFCLVPAAEKQADV